jgi:parallel beta-helix repeat protein
LNKDSWKKEDNIIIRRSYTTHLPIEVADDTELANIATGGDGSGGNPYIIEGWNITTTTSNGIYIHDTTKNFIIRNCWINASLNYHGIYIYNIGTNTANISNNVCINNFHGIFIHLASNTIVTNNIVNNNSFHGIFCLSTSEIFLKNNTCNYNINYDGIRLYASSCEAINNTCIGNGENGIFLSYDYSEAYDNFCYDNNNDGIEVSGNECIVARNNLTSNQDYGVRISTGSATLNSIYNNYFIDNNLGGTSQGFDEGTSNSWTHVSLRGNLWNDWTGGNYLIDGVAAAFDSFPLDFDTPTISQLEDIYYELNSTGNYIEWEAFDYAPDTYEIYLDSVLNETDTG